MTAMRGGEHHRAALALSRGGRRFDSSGAQTRLLRSLVRLAGREDHEFEATILDNGFVIVRGPAGTAFYPGDAWTTKVLRHLHAGFYDTRTSSVNKPLAR